MTKNVRTKRAMISAVSTGVSPMKSFGGRERERGSGRERGRENDRASKCVDTSWEMLRGVSVCVCECARVGE